MTGDAPTTRRRPAAIGAALGRIARAAAGVLRDLAAEIARLNRLDRTAGAKPSEPRGPRARRMRAALARGHDGRNRCC